jgi:type II secretory pathway predicted ATPase ExeA
MHRPQPGLRESPFHPDSAGNLLRRSPTHEEALARLQFLVENRRRLGLLLGPYGSGKSLVLDAFAEQLRRRGLPAVRIGLIAVEPAEFLRLLAAGLQLNPAPSASPVELWLAISDRLAELKYQNLQTVVLLDDADSADQRVLAQISRLARYESSNNSRLTLILASHGENVKRLGDCLLELAELRIDLQPWDHADTANFLKSSLDQAAVRSPVFSPSAVDRLYELSHGVPRRAAQLADLSLLAGAGANLPQIDADIVESAYRELSAAAEV